MLSKEPAVINTSTVPPLFVNGGSDLRCTKPTGKEEFLKDLDGGRRDFSGMDLSGLDLEDLNLKGCHFKKAIMCGTILRSSVLEDADFSGADLSKCLFEGCTFDKCNFSDAKLSGARMKLESSFRNCVFKRADLRGIFIMNTQFSRVDFTAAEASECGEVWESLFDDVSFDEAKLNLLFWKCEFHKTGFAAADFNNARFLSCTFHGPIDFQGCRGFEDVVDATLTDVNVLSLAQLPSAWRYAAQYEKERLRHEAYRPLWKAVVEGRGEDQHSPMLRMTDRLERYKAEIKELDAPTRRFLREKVSLFMEFTSEMSTAYALFREIEKIDDAMTAKENAQVGDDMLSSLCLQSGWSEEDTDADLTVGVDESWKLGASEPSIRFPHHRRRSSLGTVIDILENWGEPYPSDSTVVNTSLQERSTSDFEFSEG